MGFASTLGPFFLVIIFIGAFAFIVYDQENNLSAMRDDLEKNGRSLKSDYAINITAMTNTTTYIIVHVKNIGKKEIELDKTFVFVDGSMVPQNDGNRTIEMDAATDLRNPGLWGPSEEIIINLTLQAPIDDTTVKVVNEFGVSSEGIFEI
jgi:archaellum component FlaG (FlaF/FlaG flagellin family)